MPCRSTSRVVVSLQTPSRACWLSQKIVRRPLLGDFHFEINKRFQLFAAKIPYATEQGIFRDFKEQGIFTPDASILNFEQPQEDGAPRVASQLAKVSH